MLCSDLVFGNAYNHLIDLLEALQRTHECAMLFVFEERADKFPSLGFFEELR